ncbi:hypothetical protein HMPREF1548_00726 [Clostridium sp. KLE 1755]|nr:hypothetical protein HMPREF1548_00726 [Clostridium sp. KLE 1755]
MLCTFLTNILIFPKSFRNSLQEVDGIVRSEYYRIIPVFGTGFNLKGEKGGKR